MNLKKGFQSLFGLSLPFIKNVIPKKTKVFCVFGTPLPVEKVEKPSDKHVQEMLEKYIGCVEELYEKHKSRYNIPSDKPELKII